MGMCTMGRCTVRLLLDEGMLSLCLLAVNGLILFEIEREMQMWEGDWVMGTWEDEMSYIDKLLRWDCV